MDRKRSKDVLFFIESEVQFDSIKPLLLFIISSTKISFDIVVPQDDTKAVSSNKEIYDKTYSVIKNLGFRVTRGIDRIIVPDIIMGTAYKLQLSAYIYFWHYKNLNVKYRIMFPYASYYLNKPSWTINQFIKQDYLADALISHAVGTKPVTDIFTKTYVLPCLKLIDYQKKTMKKDKPVVLFAPTYNEIGFAINFLESVDDIKKKYEIIMRGHHKIPQVSDGTRIIDRLYEKADKIFDIDNNSITEAFEYCDIVISDNSGVIFDAIYCGVPVVLFSSDNNSFRYKDVNTKQFELTNEGYLLWTNNPAELRKLIDKTLSVGMLNKQREMRSLLFPAKTSIDPIKEWMDVLSIYLDEKMPYEYCFVKRYWIERVSSEGIDRKIEYLSGQLNEKDAQIIELNNQIMLERDPGVRILTKRLLNSIIPKHK